MSGRERISPCFCPIGWNVSNPEKGGDYMNGITRRLTALALCVMLALTTPLAAAQDAWGYTAQVLITLSDGMQYFVPAQLVTTTLGDTMLATSVRPRAAVALPLLCASAGRRSTVW